MSSNSASNSRPGSRLPPSSSTLLALDALLAARAVSTSTSSSARSGISSARRTQPLPPNRQDTLAVTRRPSRQYLGDSADTDDYDNDDESTDELGDIDVGMLTSTKELTAFLQSHLQRQQRLRQRQRVYREQQQQQQQQRLQGEHDSEDDQENERPPIIISHRDQRDLKEREDTKHDISDSRLLANSTSRGLPNPFKAVSTTEQDFVSTSRPRKPSKPRNNTIITTQTIVPPSTVSSTAREATKTTLQATASSTPASSTVAPNTTAPNSTAPNSTTPNIIVPSTTTSNTTAPAPVKRQYKKTILRQQAALLAAQIKDENEARDLEATQRVLARADVIKHLRSLRSRLTYASYKVENGLEDQPLDLVAELFDENLEDQSATSGDDDNQSLPSGKELPTPSSPPSGAEQPIVQASVKTCSRRDTSNRVHRSLSVALDSRRRSTSEDQSHDQEEWTEQDRVADAASEPSQAPSDDSESESTTDEASNPDIDLSTITLKQKELDLQQQRQIEELQQQQREQLLELKRVQKEQQMELQKAIARTAARRSVSAAPSQSSANKPKERSRDYRTAPSTDESSQHSRPPLKHSSKENRPSLRGPPAQRQNQSSQPLGCKAQRNSRSVPNPSHTLTTASPDGHEASSKVPQPQQPEDKPAVRISKDENKSPPRPPSQQQSSTQPKQEEYLQRRQQKLQQNRQREQELLQRQRQLELQQLQQHKRKQLLLQLHQQQLLEQAWEKEQSRETTPQKQRPLSVLSSQTGSQDVNRSSKPGASARPTVGTMKKKKPLNPVHKAPSTENILATVRDSTHNIRSNITAASPALSTAKSVLLGTKRMHSVFEDKENMISPSSSPPLRPRTMLTFDKENNPFYDPSQPRPKVHKKQKPTIPSSNHNSTLPVSQPTTPGTLAMEQQQQLKEPTPIVMTPDLSSFSSPATTVVHTDGSSADFAAALVAISPAVTPMLSSDPLSSEATEVNGEFLNCFDQWMSDLGSEDLTAIPIGHGFHPPFDFSAVGGDFVASGQQNRTFAAQSGTEDEIGPGGDSGLEGDETELDESELDQLLYSDVGDDYYGSYGGHASTPSSEIASTQEIGSDPVSADLYDWLPEPIQYNGSFEPTAPVDGHLSLLSMDPTLSSSPAELTHSLELTLDFGAAGDPLWLQQELRLQQERQQEQQQKQDEQQQQQEQKQQQERHEPKRQHKSQRHSKHLQTPQQHELSETEDASFAKERTPLLDSSTSTMLSSPFSEILSPSTILARTTPYLTPEHVFAEHDPSADPLQTLHKQAVSSSIYSA